MFQRYWTEEMITFHILERYGSEPLNYHHYVTHYPAVHAAGIRLFGSWKEAIEACGLDYDEIRKYKRWSKERVIEEIQKRAEHGRSMTSGYNQRRNKSLYMAAVNHFKSWGAALEAAGIHYPPVRVRKRMTAEQVEAEVRKLLASGEDLAYPNMRTNHLALLTAAARKLGGGSWDAARHHCGITTNFRKPRQGVFSAILPDESETESAGPRRRRRRPVNDGC